MKLLDVGEMAKEGKWIDRLTKAMHGTRDAPADRQSEVDKTMKVGVLQSCDEGTPGQYIRLVDVNHQKTRLQKDSEEEDMAKERK